MIEAVFTAVLGGLIVFLFAVGIAGFFALLRGSFYLRRFARGQVRDDRAALLKSPLVPAISLVATVSDASPESRQFVRKLLEVQYGKHELVLVLDGLAEADIEAWKQEYSLTVVPRNAEEALPSARIRCVYQPGDPIRMVVVNKERGGNADAHNAAVNIARTPLLGIVEPDSDFTSDAFLYLVRTLMEDPDHTIAVCGARPAGDAGNLAARFGSLESLRLWLGRCASLASRNMFASAPGCCMLVKRQAVIDAGGFRNGNLDLFLRMRTVAKAAGKPDRIAFIPAPVSHVRSATNVSALRASTMRDQQEVAGALRSHRWRTPGWPSLLVARVLRPAVEVAAYVIAAAGLICGWVHADLVVLLLLATVGMGILVSAAAVVFREQALPESSEPNRIVSLMVAALAENLGYRQLRSVWLIAGYWKRLPA